MTDSERGAAAKGQAASGMDDMSTALPLGARIEIEPVARHPA